MNRRELVSNTGPSTECEETSQSEASLMHNQLSYQSRRINELTLILYERLAHFMTSPRPTELKKEREDEFESGYFRALDACTQPTNEAISRIEEMLDILAL